MSSQRPSSSSLRQLLARWGFVLDDQKIGQIWQYHSMLRQANEELNMTRIYNFEAMVLKHYVDCLLPTRLTELPAPLLDMGTGPGLPGILIKIAKPELPMILADTRSVRCDFLESVIRKLGLKEIEIFFGSITPKYVQPVGGVITRAVADVPDTMHRVKNCLVAGGRLILMKGPDCQDEMKQAKLKYGDMFQCLEDHSYSLPESSHRRRLLVYEKLTPPESPLSDSSPTESDESHSSRRSIREIASVSNPNFQLCKDLLQGRGIRKHGLALISGRKMIEEVIRMFPDRIDAWLTDRDGQPPDEAIAASVPWLRFSKPLWEEIDQFGTRAPVLRIRTPEMDPFEFDAEDSQSGCTLLIPFQDPENVGTVLRSAAAFHVPRVVLLRESANPFHPKCLRAAGPGILGMKIYSGPSIHEIPALGRPLIALTGEGSNLKDFQWPEGFYLLPGVEGPGIPENRDDYIKVGIPIHSSVESLNASVATAIALYDWQNK
ncbi:MAG: hypothetical protein RJA81_1121 [Planctomycetota bacterium]